MSPHIQVEQVTFHSILKKVEVRESEKLYLKSNSARAYQPDLEQQATTVVNGSDTRISDKKIREESALQALLCQFVDSVQTVDQRREQALLEMQQVAIELAVAAASHLVHTVIEEDRFGIEDMVQSLFDAAEIKPSHSFIMNPEDLDLLERRLAVTTAHSELRQIKFSTDPKLSRGSYRFQTSDGKTWLSSLSLKLGEIRKHWLEELDAAQVERRESQATNSSLRRFPDRREIA